VANESPKKNQSDEERQRATTGSEREKERERERTAERFSAWLVLFSIPGGATATAAVAQRGLSASSSMTMSIWTSFTRVRLVSRRGPVHAQTQTPGIPINSRIQWCTRGQH
jgi:hypothetical protein